MFFVFLHISLAARNLWLLVVNHTFLRSNGDSTSVPAGASNWFEWYMIHILLTSLCPASSCINHWSPNGRFRPCKLSFGLYRSFQTPCWPGTLSFVSVLEVDTLKQGSTGPNNNNSLLSLSRHIHIYIIIYIYNIYIYTLYTYVYIYIYTYTQYI